MPACITTRPTNNISTATPNIFDHAGLKYGTADMVQQQPTFYNTNMHLQ